MFFGKDTFGAYHDDCMTTTGDNNGDGHLCWQRFSNPPGLGPIHLFFATHMNAEATSIDCNPQVTSVKATTSFASLRKAPAP